MPYLTQTRQSYTSSRKHGVYVTADPTALNRLELADTYPQDWKRDTIYGYRDRGLSDSGQSLNYENLTGKQLRDEVIAQGHATSEYDTGHPCKISHDSVSYRDAYTTVGVQHNALRGQFSGTLFWQPYNYAVPWPEAGFLPTKKLDWMPSSEVNGWGTRAIARFQPFDRSALNLLTSLVELRNEGLPRIPTLIALGQARAGRWSTSRTPASFSEEFLNAQFGWAPIASDIKGLCQLLVRTHDTVSKWEASSGVSRRASGVLDVTNSSDAGHYTANLYFGRWRPYDMSAAPVNITPAITSSSTSTAYWVENYVTTVRFSGAFLYHLEKLSKLSQTWLARAEHTLGLELTPENVWNTLPWTWLMGWFNDLGSIISIASYTANDSSMMKYGYLTVDTVAQREESVRIQLKDGSDRISVIRSLSTRYQRERASPYGFGVNPSAFSLKQWAILSALGLTRAPQVLKLREL